MQEKIKPQQQRDRTMSLSSQRTLKKSVPGEQEQAKLTTKIADLKAKFSLTNVTSNKQREFVLWSW